MLTVNPMNVSTQCDKCGGVLECKAGESLFTGKLRWYLSCSCKLCGPVTEIDGIGIPPENVRAAIVRESGFWFVRIDGAASNTVVAKVLMTALKISAKDAIATVSLTTDAIWKGTKIEVEWLVKMLKDAGVNATGVWENSTDVITNE